MRGYIDPSHEFLSLRRQCELLGLARSSFYYQPVEESEENLTWMRRIDEQYLKTPFYGSRRMTEHFRRQGLQVNRKRIQRLMRLMGIEAIGVQPRTSTPCVKHRVFPYLLRDVSIVRVDQVWSTDITYIPLQRGFLYLTAVLDWHSRYVISWQLSNSMETTFCLKALDDALQSGTPEIFNTDQGSQFTSHEFVGRLLESGIQVSMDGKGRAIDNVFVERLWRTVKYEEVYLHDYADGWEAERQLSAYFDFYCTERPHQALQYKTPAEVYYAEK